MKEMGQQEIDGAKKASASWERFWRIFSYPGKASAEDIAWSDDFFKQNFQNMRTIASLSSDPGEAALLELVYLGLFRRGYSLPPEFKFMRSFQN